MRPTTRDQKANQNKPDDSEAKFDTVRTFNVVKGGIPNIIETWRGATLLERVHIVKWSASGPSSTAPMIEHVRREGHFKKDAERKIVETTVSRIEWDGQFKPDDFQLPKEAIVLDRISGKRAK